MHMNIRDTQQVDPVDADVSGSSSATKCSHWLYVILLDGDASSGSLATKCSPGLYVILLVNVILPPTVDWFVLVVVPQGSDDVRYHEIGRVLCYELQHEDTILSQIEFSEFVS